MTRGAMKDTAGAPRAGAPAPVVEVNNLHVAWDTNLVLHGVDFSLLPGQTVALTGANGSGKSTTLHAILATAPITRGSVRLFGVDNAQRSRIPWKRIGYVPQRLTVGGAVLASALEVVTSGLLGPRKWWTSAKDRDKAMAALKEVGLAHRAQDPLTILSGGQAQRVLIARALVRKPDLLIMDEPMAGIDRGSRERLRDILAQAKNAGTTILVVLHELGELAPLLDREISIAHGHLAYDSTPRRSPDTFSDPSQGEHHFGHILAKRGSEDGSLREGQ